MRARTRARPPADLSVLSERRMQSRSLDACRKTADGSEGDRGGGTGGKGVLRGGSEMESREKKRRED